MSDQTSYLTIEELADRVGVPVRTVRFYIGEGLLPGPEGRGKAAFYDEEHLLRLRLIRLLAEQRVPLAEIRTRLAGLSAAEIRSLLQTEEQQATSLQQAQAAPSPREYIAQLLRRRPSVAEETVSYSQRPQAWPAPGPLLESRGAMAPRPAPQPETWHRYQLAPGVELQVTAEAEKSQRKLIARLIEAAKSTEREEGQ